MTGLSLRSMLLNLFFQTVILLYLLDNETSWMILLSSVSVEDFGALAAGGCGKEGAPSKTCECALGSRR